jgi:hypothetical protein
MKALLPILKEKDVAAAFNLLNDLRENLFWQFVGRTFSNIVLEKDKAELIDVLKKQHKAGKINIFSMFEDWREFTNINLSPPDDDDPYSPENLKYFEAATTGQPQPDNF